MAIPKPQGRMIRVSIADDEGLAKLSDGAARLYFYLMPHLTAHGKFAGGASTMQENVVPLLGWTRKRIIGYLAEINTHTSMHVWKQNGRFYVHDGTFFERNEIRSDRMGRDSIPPYPGLDRMKTGTSKYSLPEFVPDLLPHEVEVEVEVEVEEEVMEKKASQRQPHAHDTPVRGGFAAKCTSNPSSLETFPAITEEENIEQRILSALKESEASPVPDAEGRPRQRSNVLEYVPRIRE